MYVLRNDNVIIVVCRSGSAEQYAEKKKLLQDITDLRADADERAHVLKLAKKAENEAKKKSADLHLVAMRISKAGTCRCTFVRRYCNSKGTCKGGGVTILYLLLVTPRMENDVLIGEESGESNSESAKGADERAVPEQRASDREPPRKSVYSYLATELRLCRCKMGELKILQEIDTAQLGTSSS